MTTWAAGAASFEQEETVGCEVLRGPLKLPSCPDGAAIEGAEVTFRGRGRGHSLGLDLEAARRSGQPQEEILRAAYGF